MTKLFQDLNNGNVEQVWNKIQTEQSHADIHVNQSFEKMTDRALHENLTNVSTFESEEQAMYCMLDALIMNSDIIDEMLKYGDNNQRSIITTDLYDGFEEDYGVPRTFYGIEFNNSLKVKSTNRLKVILEKDVNTPYGIKMITMFPEFENSEENTVKQSSKKIKIEETNAYINGSKEDKIYLKLLQENNRVYRLNESIVIHDIKPNGEHYKLFLNDFDTKFKIYKQNIETDKLEPIKIPGTEKYVLCPDRNETDLSIIRNNFLKQYRSYITYKNIDNIKTKEKEEVNKNLEL